MREQKECRFMQKKWQYAAIGGGAAVLLLVIVLVAVGGGGPDIAGKYELLIGGEVTDTVIEIMSSGDGYLVTLQKGDKVRSEYLVPRLRGGSFVIERTKSGLPGDRFDLTVVDGGLKGTADIPSLASGISVFFRKM